MNKRDLEAELAQILQDEIWKEIELESGMTREKYDQQMIDMIRKCFEETKEPV